MRKSLIIFRLTMGIQSKQIKSCLTSKKTRIRRLFKNTSFTKNDDIRGFSTSSADKSQVLSKQDKFLNLNIIQSKKTSFFNTLIRPSQYNT
jgi:hypothetical protein